MYINEKVAKYLNYWLINIIHFKDSISLECNYVNNFMEDLFYVCQVKQ